jgi:copper homeostasis protein CutC/mannose/cellobiose epimerase-like protein (N-acyl-D-glucosamine 2-epimerase family)
MSEYLLEVITCSVEDAREAERGGAGRLEVVRDLPVGGLTPPLQLVREILDAVSIPIRVMIRERSDYCAGADVELERLCLLAAEMNSLPIDGLVLGFLTDVEVDFAGLNKILSKVPECRITFHHAFDALANPLDCIDRLSQIRQIDYILTAGGSGAWPDRKRRLVEYSEHERPGIKILAGGGMSAQTIHELSQDTQIHEFHVGTAAREKGRVSGRRVEALSKLLANAGTMNRRVFQQTLLGVPALLSSNKTTSMPRSLSEPKTLNFPAMRSQYRNDLFSDYLPFLEKFVIDREYGGFHCSVRPNGELVSTVKRAWFEGRGTWVFSFLYNNIAREQKYLDMAARSIALIQRSKPKDPDEFWPKELKRDGSPAGPPDTEVYGDMFIAEGLAEFSRASGERKYWDEAREIVFKCVRRYDQPDYHPTIGQTYLGPGAPDFPGARIGGVWMVFIHTCSQMLEMHPDSELLAIVNRAADALLNHHFNARFQLLNELMNHDLSRPKNEYEQLVYAGHAIETLWMTMYEARRRNDVELFDRAAAMFRRHCDVAKDRVYGGLFRNLTNVDQNAWTLDKTLFPQQEALIGSLCLIEETSDPWAVEFYLELDRYVRTKFPMRSLHSPLWQVAGNRQVDPTPDMARAENYHQPRFLMLNLLAVERLIERKGKPIRAV